MKKHRGMSLLEMVIVTLLSALVLGMVAQFFLSAMHIGRRSVVRSGLSQTGMAALLGLMNDLQQANAGGLTFQLDSERRLADCVIHPVEDVSADGLPQYSIQELQHYAFDLSKSLLRRRKFDRRRPSPIPLREGEPMRFSPGQIQLLARAKAEERSFPNVVTFRIFSYGVEPEFVGNPLRIEIVLRDQGEEIQCIRSVALRNSL